MHSAIATQTYTYSLHGQDKGRRVSPYMFDAAYPRDGLSLPAVAPAAVARLRDADAAVPFALTTADAVTYTFFLSPRMCSHSLYLQTAKEVAAREGHVPVGTAQAVRDYVAYLQYVDLRAQLATELAKGCNAQQREHGGRPTDAAAASPAVAAPLPIAGRQPALTAAAAVAATTTTASVAAGGTPWAVAREPSEDVWMSPFLWEEALLNRATLNNGNASEEPRLTPPTFDGNGVIGYELQPLDCDRTYAQHAATLRHWLTVGELAALRGEAALAESDDADGRGDGQRVEGQEGRTHVVLPGTDVVAAPPGPNPGHAVHATADAVQLHPQLTQSAAVPSSRSSSTASSSSSASLSAASLAAYKAEVRRQMSASFDVPSLGQEPGYGAHLALDDAEGVFFIERVLLSHVWHNSAGGEEEEEEDTLVKLSDHHHNDSSHTTKLTGQPHMERGSAASPSPMTGFAAHASPSIGEVVEQDPPLLSSSFSPTSRVALSVRQQRRLLELISVADFLGTQSLVELCANYLAAWLMDRTDDEIVRSFLTAPAQESAGVPCGEGMPPTSPPPQPLYELTGATAFQEPWLRQIVPAERTTASAKAAVTTTASAAPQSPTNVVSTSKDAKTARKKNAAVGGKKKGRRCKDAEELKDKREGEEAAGGGPPAAATTMTANTRRSLLSGDQRLSVVRQVKHDGSIMVSPY